jgi:hypothetical protein
LSKSNKNPATRQQQSQGKVAAFIAEASKKSKTRAAAERAYEALKVAPLARGYRLAARFRG